MINFVLTPDWVEAILGTIEGLSFICSSLIVLRYIIVALSIANFFFCYWVGLETAEHVSILLLAILHFTLNIYMISIYYYSRSIRSVPLGWRETYKKYFSIFLPFEFKNMLKFGNIIKHKKDTPLKLVNKNSEFQNLAFIVQGGASITIDKEVEVAKLNKGDWISEFSFITGDKTSANVVSNDIYALSWSKTTLEKLKDRKPELFEKLNALIAKNLCEKLIRSNKK
ncbi:hypothetical protein OA409_02635 [Prochlorococcus sp. AH-716-M06]|nr:hypothetical protein [Prochlorococcus sp. AH-716-M06]|tara:strand:- start:430 stop:1107 length:678 start_codon:yes stop_codon:yes gene_type:complete